MNELFRRFSGHVSRIVGSFWAMLLLMVIVIGSGEYYNFSNVWKANASLAASLVALLLLFFLQKSQNHSDVATHLKLDELIRATDRARDEIVSVEEQTEKDLQDLKNIEEDKE